MIFKYAALLFALSLLPSPCPAQDNHKSEGQSSIESRYIPVHTFDATRNAAADVEQAVAEARKTGKHILLEVGGDWCPWCHALERLLQEHPELLQVRDESFITVAVYYNSDKKNEELLSHYPKVLGIPHFFILDEAGTLLHSQHGVELQTNGNYSPDKIKAFLDEWSPHRVSGAAKTDSNAHNEAFARKLTEQ